MPMNHKKLAGIEMQAQNVPSTTELVLLNLMTSKIYSHVAYWCGRKELNQKFKSCLQYLF